MMARLAEGRRNYLDDTINIHPTSGDTNTSKYLLIGKFEPDPKAVTEGSQKRRI